MKINKIILTILILVNFGLMVVTSYCLKRISEIEAKTCRIEKQVNNPEIKIIPTK